MFGIILDFFVVWGIVRLLAGSDVSEYKLHFVGFLIGMIIVSVVIVAMGPPLALAFAIFFLGAMCGMKFLLGATWLGSLVGASLYVGYKIALAFLFS